MHNGLAVSAGLTNAAASPSYQRIRKTRWPNSVSAPFLRRLAGKKALGQLSLGRFLRLPDSEDFGAARRTNTPCGGTAVPKGYLMWIPYLPLTSAFETVSLHNVPPNMIRHARWVWCRWTPFDSVPADPILSR